MRELILIFSYIVCAFVPVIILKKSRGRIFWITWLISLIGAFAGGVLGSLAAVRSMGAGTGFLTSILPGFAGAWLFSFIFIKLRNLPDNW